MPDDGAERFERIYRENFRPVLGYLLSRVDPDSATDAVAETFLVAWRRLDDVPETALPWLLGVARKVVAGQRRQATRREALWSRLAHSERAMTVGFETDVAEQQVIFQALATLRDPDREALLLVAWDGLPAAAAADVLGISRVAFGVRLHRARRRFATALESAARSPHGPDDRRAIAATASRPPGTMECDS